jgi:superkiller protein 3
MKTTEVYERLGGAYRHTREYDKALAAYRRAMDQEPKNLARRYDVAIILAEMGRDDDAIAEYDKILALTRNSTWPTSKKGHLPQTGQARSRGAGVHGGADGEPRPRDRVFRAGAGLRAHGQTGAAAAAYREVAQLNPYVGNVNTRLGEIALADGKLDSSIAYFKRALEHDSEHFMIYFHLANAYQKRGNLREAADAYQQVIKLFPVLFDARYNLGVVYGRQGKFDAAAKEFEET